MKRKLNKSANAMRKKGTGKSLSKIKSDNIQVSGSYVVTDPKGELYRNSENLLVEKRIFINLIDTSKSSTYVPAFEAEKNAKHH